MSVSKTKRFNRFSVPYSPFTICTTPITAIPTANVAADIAEYEAQNGKIEVLGNGASSGIKGAFPFNNRRSNKTRG